MQTIKEEALTFFTKWGYYIFYVFLGIMGKFSYDIVRKRKISLWYAIGVTGISCFIGFLACVWCSKHDAGYAPFVVPIVTLFSDRILMYLAALNWKPILDSIYGTFSKKS